MTNAERAAALRAALDELDHKTSEDYPILAAAVKERIDKLRESDPATAALLARLLVFIGERQKIIDLLVDHDAAVADALQEFLQPALDGRARLSRV